MKIAILFLAPLLRRRRRSPADAGRHARRNQEPKLEKRAHAALDNAGGALSGRSEAYTSGDNAGADPWV